MKSMNDGKLNASLGMEFFVDYSHLLPGHPKCGVKHGHTAKVVVEIKGKIPSVPDRTRGGNPETSRTKSKPLDGTAGMIMDFAELKDRVWKVLSKIDHTDLNEKFRIPTSETVVSWIYSELKSSNLPVSKVTFFEGNGKWCSVET
jgi:6-pyruvoyltetrahydropterin/6-carboxytetrahydropterin synthase